MTDEEHLDPKPGVLYQPILGWPSHDARGKNISCVGYISFFN